MADATGDDDVRGRVVRAVADATGDDDVDDEESDCSLEKALLAALEEDGVFGAEEELPEEPAGGETPTASPVPPGGETPPAPGLGSDSDLEPPMPPPLPSTGGAAASSAAASTALVPLAPPGPVPADPRELAEKLHALGGISCGPFRITPTKKGKFGELQVSCPFHKASSRTGCKRRAPVLGPSVEDKIRALELLMWWCAVWRECPRQREHKVKKISAELCPTFIELRAQLRSEAAPEPGSVWTDQDLDRLGVPDDLCPPESWSVASRMQADIDDARAKAKAKAKARGGRAGGGRGARRKGKGEGKGKGKAKERKGKGKGKASSSDSTSTSSASSSSSSTSSGD